LLFEQRKRGDGRYCGVRPPTAGRGTMRFFEPECREAASWGRPLQIAVNLSPAATPAAGLVADQ